MSWAYLSLSLRRVACFIRSTFLLIYINFCMFLWCSCRLGTRSPGAEQRRRHVRSSHSTMGPQKETSSQKLCSARPYPLGWEPPEMGFQLLLPPTSSITSLYANSSPNPPQSSSWPRITPDFCRHAPCSFLFTSELNFLNYLSFHNQGSSLCLLVLCK